MDLSLPPLIRALLDPALYPGHVERVDLVQTHGAWVLLAGDCAYKIKKPVKLGFMDFSTLALRHAACQAELRVNRRFPAGQALYLGVRPVLGTPEAPRWGAEGQDAAGAIEFAVQMRRFDEAGRLDHLCLDGALQAQHMVQLAQSLAEFQGVAAVAPHDRPWGQVATVQAVVQDNLDALQGLLAGAGQLQPLQQLQRLQAWHDRHWPAVRQQLAARRQAGRVREGHGDLHLANLVLIDGRVVPFDAIEFSDALRWVDVASDLAFTWMDLQRMGQPGLAHVLASEWVDASGDVSAPQVLPFFAVYLALVRAKVAAIRRTQLDANDVQAHAACEAEVAAYLTLAWRLAHPPAPRLLITHGLSGCGKSHAAQQWLLQHPGSQALRLRSDVERKRLHGLAPLQASDPAGRADFYGTQASARTYASLRERARQLLQQGWTVVVDAAFLRRQERDDFARLASELDCPFHILAPHAPLALLRERIAARQATGGDPSEATLAVLERQLQWIEPLGGDEPRAPLQ